MKPIQAPVCYDWKPTAYRYGIANRDDIIKAFYVIMKKYIFTTFNLIAYITNK